MDISYIFTLTNIYSQSKINKSENLKGFFFCFSLRAGISLQLNKVLCVCGGFRAYSIWPWTPSFVCIPQSIRETGKERKRASWSLSLTSWVPFWPAMNSNRQPPLASPNPLGAFSITNHEHSSALAACLFTCLLNKFYLSYFELEKFSFYYDRFIKCVFYFLELAKWLGVSKGRHFNICPCLILMFL